MKRAACVTASRLQVMIPYQDTAVDSVRVFTVGLRYELVTLRGSALFMWGLISFDETTQP
jgi:hypothetical protein